ncbi:serine hydrolase domain-containing protein [Streptomyces sp. NPDC048172]|uniref:serine hydrolase domain-containing protein n=1 Tax=Streptomyces sp. NPDC048172 TaxID=3365505 RepID=UPI0037108DA4
MTPYRRALGGLLVLATAAGLTACAGNDDDTSGQRKAERSASTHASGTHASGTHASGTHANAARSTTGHPRTRALLKRLTTKDGGPGASVALRDRTGSRVLTSGLADVKSKEPMRADSRFRIGSMTKPFVATVVLQLVGEGRMSLDAPVERYLPGLIRGHGNDGRKITVRQVLQQTSGLPDYLNSIKTEDVLKNPLTHYEARDLVKRALRYRPGFEPGKKWEYSNTNYVLAGLLVERVTGNTYGHEIRRRVIEPLGLRQTSVPHDSTKIRGPHPRGYARPGKDAPLQDITALNPTVLGPSGSMISNGADFNRFLDALVHGKLLRAAEQRELTKTRPTGDGEGGAYGLGIESHPLSCGGLSWGADGGVPGYQTLAAVTRDGRRATGMVNLYPGETNAQDKDLTSLVRTALCEGRAAKPHK